VKLQNIVESKQLAGYALKVKGKEFNIETKAKAMVQGLLKQIEIRYKDLDVGVLDATVIGSFQNWPNENKAGITFLDCDYVLHIVNFAILYL
jgi:hypothetical protein